MSDPFYNGHEIPSMSRADISRCGKYRWRLDRPINLPLDQRTHALLIGVNPSDADATKNDATIRKDLGFARRLGWSHITKGNLLGYRATKVSEIAQVDDPVGCENDKYLVHMMQEVDLVVACWGPPEKLPKRFRNEWRKVVGMAHELRKPLYCLGVTKGGHPRHTLMTPYSTPLTVWQPPK